MGNRRKTVSLHSYIQNEVMNLHRPFFLLWAIVFSMPCFAQQYELSGRVTDAKTQEEMVYVHVKINESNHGTITDIKGFFTVAFHEPIRKLTFQALGYETLTYEVKADDYKKKLHIKMQSKVFDLLEVNVQPKESPANRIIREVLKNRDKNNPEKQKSFSCTSYNIGKIEAIMGDSWDTVPDDYPTDRILTKKDSSLISDKKEMKTLYAFVTESVVEKKFKYPDKNYEEVVASRTAGMKNPIISVILSQMQSFSFYSEDFSILGIKYVNPISKGTFSRYYFDMQDTIYQGDDTVFVISFFPFYTADFKGLDGLLYVNTNGYAVQHVSATTSNRQKQAKKAADSASVAVVVDEVFINLFDIPLNVKQDYQLIEGQWFPKQAVFEVGFNAPKEDYRLSINTNTLYSDIKLNPELKNREFSDVILDISPKATEQKDDFWSPYRDTLNDRIANSYHFFDSVVGKDINLDKWVFILKTLAEGKITLKWIDFDLQRIFSYNGYEGCRLGLGIQTNDRLSRWFSIGGYGGYGLRDYAWKYGVFGEIYFDKYKSYVLKISHAADLENSGEVANLKQHWLSLNQYQNFLYHRFENKKNAAVSFTFPAINYMTVEIGMDYSQKQTLFDYAFFNGEEYTKNYTFTDINLKIRYAFKEKKMRLGAGFMIKTETKFPVLYLTYTRGTDLFGGQYKYNRITGLLTYNIDFKQFGKSSIILQGGYVDAKVPYNRLFIPSGTKNSQAFFFDNGFAAMHRYDYAANYFASAFLTHNFGKIFWKRKYSSPELILKANLLWGGYAGKANWHQNITYRTPNKGYFETGVLMDKLFTYSTIAFGGGVFYRINEHFSPRIFDRFAFVWTVGFNF